MTSSLRDVPPDAMPSPEAIAALDPRIPDEVSAVLGFGGPATPYALAVHENPRAGKTGGVSPSGKRYKHWAEVGQWKFLEIPLLEAEHGMLARLAGRIRSALGGRLGG